MQGISVRPETSEDLRAIDVVHLSAFEGDQEVGLVSALRRAPEFDPELSLVAEFHGRIVGHVLLTRALLKRGQDTLEVAVLAPMAVVPSQSHRGIGSALLAAAEERARERGFAAIVEVGQPEFYRRFGFRPASDWELRCNLPVEQEMMTAKELQPGRLAGGGLVLYPSEFLQLFERGAA